MNPIPRLLAPAHAARYAAWSLLGAAVATACGGASFSGSEPSAGQNSGGASAGAKASLGGDEGSQAGTDSWASGGPFSGAGGDYAGAAGDHSGAAGDHTGSAGAPALLDCADLAGSEHDRHCYVDITTDSMAYEAAVAACSLLAAQSGRPGQLLVLGSEAEQAFVLQQFLKQFTDKSDAWLGMTCSTLDYPEFSSCYCKDCDAEQRAEKRAVWSWLDGTTATFGWVGQNPDGEGRCAALAYNPVNTTWGWVDRSCTKTTHQLTGYPAHDYRTICELE